MRPRSGSLARIGILMGAVMLATVATLGAVGPSAAATPWSSTRTASVTCDAGDATPQLCDPAYVHNVFVGRGKTIVVKRIRYQAAEAHCSSARIHVYRNGKKVGATGWVAAGEVAVIKDLSITLHRRAGGKPHRFTYRAQGRTEGCNTGYVGGWGGSFKLSGVKKA